MFLSVTAQGQLLALLNEWAIQLLVLFSFALQVFLLLFAWIRRHNVSPFLRLLLWLAYQLADSTALFTLGHLSISSRLQKHQLVAFWAPLLLVHLGGQDTITAYSSEDNGIWLRHLQTLIVQLMGASFVLYRYIPGSETLVIAAAVLIFIVGVLKYVERIWALKCASLDSIWSSMDRSDTSDRDKKNDYILRKLLKRRHCLDTEQILMAAHTLLDVCKGLFIGLRRVERHTLHSVVHSFDMCGHLDELMEMELSLMYDIMYTKSTVIHTLYGCCVRIISPISMVAAFILFLVSSKEKHDRHDIIISYVLLVGGLVLEMVSVIRAVGSTWTGSLLYDKKWRWLHDELRALRQIVGAANYRRWSGAVGQYNLFRSCSQHKIREPRRNKMVISRLLRLEPVSDWWTDRHSQWSEKVPASTKELVLRELLRIAGQPGKKMGSFPGLLTLQHYKLHGLLGWSIEDIGFEDSIIAWHVATEVCLFKDRSGKKVLVDATRLLSNYMMFLLVKCPYMLPGPVSHNPCLHVRDALCKLMEKDATTEATPEKRVEWLLHTGLHAVANSFHGPGGGYDHAGVRLADMLYHRHNRMEVIFGVWVEMLCYVADHCSRESHSRQLCRGGELVTIVWLMARHADMYYS